LEVEKSFAYEKEKSYQLIFIHLYALNYNYFPHLHFSLFLYAS
jgi:hypothetical protein